MPREVVPGQVVAGKYRVDRLLGRGGMGVVVAATDEELGRRVAIKLMLEADTSGQGLERFRREAGAAAALRSEHVAKVYDMGALETGERFIVMELLDGEDLEARLGRCGVLPIPDAVEYVLQACEAIGEAHAAGIVHRDIKPANLFLTTSVSGAPCVKVFDFGVSRLTKASVRLTGERAYIGSPLYMAPEQARGFPDVDGRADVWALGATLFELLGGQTPFLADTFEAVMGRILHDSPTRLAELRPDVPPQLEAAILGALVKERERRWPDVAAFAAALAPFAPAGAQGRADRVPGALGVRVEPPSSPALPSSAAASAVGSGSASGAWAAATPPVSAAAVGQVSAQGAPSATARGKGGAAVAIVLVMVGLLAASSALFVLKPFARTTMPAPDPPATSTASALSAAPPAPAPPASASVSAEPTVSPAPAPATASATAPAPVPIAPASRTAHPVRSRPSATPTAAPRPSSDVYHARD